MLSDNKSPSAHSSHTFSVGGTGSRLVDGMLLCCLFVHVWWLFVSCLPHTQFMKGKHLAEKAHTCSERQNKYTHDISVRQITTPLTECSVWYMWMWMDTSAVATSAPFIRIEIKCGDAWCAIAATTTAILDNFIVSLLVIYVTQMCRMPVSHSLHSHFNLNFRCSSFGL